MKNTYKYYQMRRFEKVFYATDKNENVYFFETFSWLPDYWQKITWKVRKELGKKYMGSARDTRQINESHLKEIGVPLIKFKTLKDQPPYEYFQDIEEDWIYYARDEDFNVFIYRNPVGRKYKKKPPEKWERVLDSGFIQYCKKNMSLLQQSNPRTEEYLQKEGVPLIKEKEVIECTDNHIYT